MRASNAHYEVAKWYVRQSNCKVVMPDYRLMPAYKYPVAIADCYNTYLWVLKHAGDLSVDKERIILTGDSAGGNIAGAVTAMSKDKGDPIPKGLMMIYPVLDKRMKTESMKRFTDTPIWDSRCTKLFWDMYLKDVDADRAKYASISEAKDISFFPDTYVEAAEFDCLHDEGIAFAKRLQSEGVAVEVHDIKGACHGYEAVWKSNLVATCMQRRIRWINNLWETNVTPIQGRSKSFNGR
ncbi:MAG: alpha/beta hydrolase [Lachnospiraceae bacterium]|nr:alpha/beta hydrolase [Lachnospiraceae bacterium]